MASHVFHWFRRQRKWIRASLLTIIVTVVWACGFIVLGTLWARQARDTAYQAAVAAGLPATFQEMRSVPHPATDANNRFRALAKAIERTRYQPSYVRLEQSAFEPLSKKAAWARKYIADNPHLLRLESNVWKSTTYMSNPHPEEALWKSVHSPEGTAELSRWLAIRRLAESSGPYDQELDRMTNLLRLSEVVWTEKTEQSRHLRRSFRMQVLKSLTRLVVSGRLTPVQLRRVSQIVTDLESPSDEFLSLRDEFARYLAFEELATTGKLSPYVEPEPHCPLDVISNNLLACLSVPMLRNSYFAYCYREQTYALHLYRATRHLERIPSEQMMIRSPLWLTGGPGVGIYMVLWQDDDEFQDPEWYVTHVRLLRCTLDMIMKRGFRGPFPDQMERTVHDPASGYPIIYRRLQYGFVVYSERRGEVGDGVHGPHYASHNAIRYPKEYHPKFR
ncbi:MAG: hypothetical protein SFX74_03665 [Fimbriimonadaceae bacterium]|nr:hypothetical protein [Fimbriimonadaceae bacterium]